MATPTSSFSPEIEQKLTDYPISSFVRSFRRAFIDSFGDVCPNSEQEGASDGEQQDPSSDSGSEELDPIENFLANFHFNMRMSFLTFFVQLANGILESKFMLNVLLSSLAYSPVANVLMVHSRTLASVLLQLLEKLNRPQSKNISLEDWNPLIRYIITGEGLDATVWRMIMKIFQSVLTLTQSLDDLTSSSAAARLQTPISRNSAATVYESVETHYLIDKPLRAELNKLIFPGTPRLFEIFFENKSWSREAEDIYRLLPPTIVTSAGWPGWPANCEQDGVLNWFDTCINPILANAGAERSFGHSQNNPLEITVSRLKPDIFLHAASNRSPTWADILVIGELKKSRARPHSPEIVVELANYVRQIFIAQQRRRFVHAFTICGDQMRCWVFHRGGGFTSGFLSIQLQPVRFLSVILGYARMNEAELGFDPTLVQQPRGFLSLTCTLPDNTSRRMILEAKPVCITPSIASRGTTCWSAKFDGDDEFNYVVKDAWRPECSVSEGILLAEAQKAGVKGIVQYVTHQDVQIDGVTDTTVAIARGLEFKKKPLNLRPGDPLLTSNSYESNGVGPELPCRAKSAVELGDIDRPPPPRRPSLFNLEALPSNRKRSIASLDDESEGDEDEPEHTPATSAPCTSSSCSSSSSAYSSGSENSPSRRTTIRTKYLPAAPRKRRKVNPPEPKELARVHTRLITVKGRSITKFDSNLELLYALRDAIKGHQSLYGHKILHRDISTNNIMIAPSTSPPRPDGFKGFLIDLDLAIHLDALNSTSRHRTGTIEFMAIGVMDGDLHTYRHDLESFFYVFLWICVHMLPCGERAPAPTTNLFQRWATGSWAEASEKKFANMDPIRFEKQVLTHFNTNALNLKKLSVKLRDALFPYRGGIFLGTDPDSGRLYAKMIRAFDHTIKKLERRLEKRRQRAEPGS